MKIVARTENELIIRDSAMPIRAIGAFLFPFGGLAVWLAFTTDPDAGVKLAPLIIGTILVMGGIALLVMLPAER